MSRPRFTDCRTHGYCAVDEFGDCVGCIQDLRVASGVCACGCGEPLPRPNARSHSAPCRTRAWKARAGYKPQRVRKPSRNASPRRRQTAPRISYARAVEAVEAALADPATYEGSRRHSARERAEQILEPVLPPSARRAA